MGRGDLPRARRFGGAPADRLALARAMGADVTIPWRAIGARTYALADVNQALADAEAMRLPKALVKPN